MTEQERWLFLVLREVVMDSGIGWLDEFTQNLVSGAYRQLRDKWLETPDGQLWQESL